MVKNRGEKIMTREIQNLTGLIYGWFLGIVYMIPNMIHTMKNISSQWILASFYIGCLVLVIPFMIERHRKIRLLNNSSAFQLLYRREFMVAIFIIIIKLGSSLLIFSYFLGTYHAYWTYKNYFTLGVNNPQN